MGTFFETPCTYMYIDNILIIKYIIKYRYYFDILTRGVAPIGGGVAPAMCAGEGAGHAAEQSGANLGPPTCPLRSTMEQFQKQGVWLGCAEGTMTSFVTAPPQAQSEPTPALILAFLCKK